jgi:hypothetical protein
MTAAQYSWFWQPPLDGKPGLMMIVDEHPGPDRPDVPLLLEQLKTVLHEIEAKLPADVGFHQLRIYIREPIGAWFQIHFTVLNRRFQMTAPDFPQASLCELWDSRQ